MLSTATLVTQHQGLGDIPIILIRFCAYRRLVKIHLRSSCYKGKFICPFSLNIYVMDATLFTWHRCLGFKYKNGQVIWVRRGRSIVNFITLGLEDGQQLFIGFSPAHSSEYEHGSSIIPLVQLWQVWGLTIYNQEIFVETGFRSNVIRELRFKFSLFEITTKSRQRS